MPVEDEEVFLTHRGRAVAVLGQVTLVAGVPADFPFGLHLKGERNHTE